jgi:hypothetical protein
VLVAMKTIVTSRMMIVHITPCNKISHPLPNGLEIFIALYNQKLRFWEQPVYFFSRRNQVGNAIEASSVMIEVEM